jgi:glycogen operon protein
VILNMSDQTFDVPVPPIPGRRWHLALDTSRPPPGDVLAPEQQTPHPDPSFTIFGRTVAVLEARTRAD